MTQTGILAVIVALSIWASGLGVGYEIGVHTERERNKPKRGANGKFISKNPNKTSLDISPNDPFGYTKINPKTGESEIF